MGDDDIIKKLKFAMGRGNIQPQQRPVRKRKQNKKTHKKSKKGTTVIHNHYHNQPQPKQQSMFGDRTSLSGMFNKEGNNNNDMSLAKLLNKKSDSPYSFSNSFNKKGGEKKKQNISPYFFLGLMVYIIALLGPMYVPFIKNISPFLTVIGIGCILIGVFFTGVPKEKRKAMKRTWWTFVNKIRVKKGKSIKCLNCGKDDFTIRQNGTYTCDNCGEELIWK